MSEDITIPDRIEATQFETWNITLTPNQTRTVEATRIPDVWVVGLVSRNGTRVDVYWNNTTVGPFLSIGDGGVLRLPGRTLHITVQNSSGVDNSIVNIIALSGLEFDFIPLGR